MNNEEKAKVLMSRINILLGTFIMIVKDNVDNNSCLIKEWDTYIKNDEIAYQRNRKHDDSFRHKITVWRTTWTYSAIE